MCKGPNGHSTFHCAGDSRGRARPFCGRRRLSGSRFDDRPDNSWISWACRSDQSEFVPPDCSTRERGAAWTFPCRRCQLAQRRPGHRDKTCSGSALYILITGTGTLPVLLCSELLAGLTDSFVSSAWESLGKTSGTLFMEAHVQHTCGILHLELGPVDLTLLGLEVILTTAPTVRWWLM